MPKDTMPKPDTGVHRRPGSTAWQWRIKTPLDLRPLYRREWAHRGSLKTSDLRQANAKAASLRAEWLARFERERKSLNPEVATAISPEMGKVLARAVMSRLLAIDEKLRTEPATAQLLMGALHAAVPSKLTIGPVGPAPLPQWLTALGDPLEGLPSELAAELAALNSAMDANAAFQMATQRIAAVLPLAQEEGRKLGLIFDAKTPGALEALRECLKTYRKARSDIVSRDRGEVIETPQAPTKEQAQEKAKPVTLRDVFELWKGKKLRGDDSLKACQRAVTLFEQRTGNTPVKQITRAQGDDFRAWLQTLGSASKTAHDRLTWVKSLLGYAHRDLELIPRQPWEGIEIEYRTEKKRKPWTDEQLTALFSRPLFTEYKLPTVKKAGADAAYWIPLLAIFTGCRVSELAQLRVSDIDDRSEIPTITVTDEGEDQQVKSEAGIRSVPLHSELIRLGFLDYVARTRDQQVLRLFPALPLRVGKPGGYFSQWFNENRPTGTPDFHSFRHLVRSTMVEAGVSEAAMDSITGHTAKGSVGTKVYTTFRKEFLRDAVEKIRYSALSLSRVSPV